VERYYDENSKEFHDLKLGQMTIEDFVTKFVNPMRYVPYHREEKEKVKRCMICFPQAFRD
jgi:hypothetical protein